MEFKREDRYVVLKRKDLVFLSEAQKRQLSAIGEKIQRLRGPRLECLVVESDWPEFEPTWAEIQRRMEGKPTIMEEELGRWQDEIYKLCGELAPDADIDGGGCDSGDPLDLTTTEIAQAFNYWDNLLFDTMESVSHSYVDTPTFKAAADLITKLHAENEQLSQQVCSDCDPENYGWVFNRVEGKAACGCIVEAEPFQILLKALERLAKGEHSGSFFLAEQIAKEALRSVLPLDYQEPV